MSTATRTAARRDLRRAAEQVYLTSESGEVPNDDASRDAAILRVMRARPVPVIEIPAGEADPSPGWIVETLERLTAAGKLREKPLLDTRAFCGRDEQGRWLS